MNNHQEETSWRKRGHERRPNAVVMFIYRVLDSNRLEKFKNLKSSLLKWWEKTSRIASGIMAFVNLGLGIVTIYDFISILITGKSILLKKDSVLLSGGYPYNIKFYLFYLFFIFAWLIGSVVFYQTFRGEKNE